MSEDNKPELHPIPCRMEITKRIVLLGRLYTNSRRFPFGLIGPMWYHTPVVWDEVFDKCKWRYGVEFEVAFKRVGNNGVEWDEYPKQAAMIANHILATTTKLNTAGITLDQTIERGWEIVLGAMSIDKVVRVITPIITDPHIYQYLDSGVDAGLHITVDPFRTPGEQRAFHDFWNHPSLFEDFKHIIHRQENKYCKRREVKGKGFMKPDTRESHYNRCNVRTNGAMEVRVFKAVYHPDNLREQLMMVHAVNKAVRDGVRSYEDLSNEVMKYIKG